MYIARNDVVAPPHRTTISHIAESTQQKLGVASSNSGAWLQTDAHSLLTMENVTLLTVYRHIFSFDLSATCPYVLCRSPAAVIYFFPVAAISTQSRSMVQDTILLATCVLSVLSYHYRTGIPKVLASRTSTASPAAQSKHGGNGEGQRERGEIA